MKIYLEKRYEHFKSAKFAQTGCLILLIAFFLFVLFIIYSNGFQSADSYDLIIFSVIIAILLVISIGINMLKINLKKPEIEILKIIIAFLKEAEINNEEIILTIKKIFSIYSNKNIDLHTQTILFSKVDIDRASQDLSKETSDIKYFVLYSLLDLAANDSILTINEENFITKVRKGLNIHEITYNNIKNSYTKKGLKEERKILEEEARRKTAKEISKSFIPYNAYKILGITPSNTKLQLKKAYRTLAKKYHPDKFAGQSEEIIQKAEDKFQEISEAYEIVKQYKKNN